MAPSQHRVKGWTLLSQRNRNHTKPAATIAIARGTVAAQSGAQE